MNFEKARLPLSAREPQGGGRTVPLAAIAHSEGMGCGASAPRSEGKPWGLSAAYLDTQPVPKIPDLYAKEMASTLADFKNRAVTIDATDDGEDERFSSAITSSFSEDISHTPPPQWETARLRQLETMLDSGPSEAETISEITKSRLLMYYVRMVDTDRTHGRSFSCTESGPVMVDLASITERSASMSMAQRSHRQRTTASGSLRAARTQRVFSDPPPALPKLTPEVTPQHSFNDTRLNDAAPSSNLVNTAARSVLEMADRPAMTSMLAYVEANPGYAQQFGQERH